MPLPLDFELDHVQQPVVGEDPGVGAERDGDRVGRPGVHMHLPVRHADDQLGEVRVVLDARDLDPVEGSADVRDQATEIDVPVLNKPIKPAQLRSLLARWQRISPAAE